MGKGSSSKTQNVTILLLGAVESGKSTILKQILLECAPKAVNDFCVRNKTIIRESFFLHFWNALDVAVETFGKSQNDSISRLYRMSEDVSKELAPLNGNNSLAISDQATRKLYKQYASLIHEVWETEKVKKLWDMRGMHNIPECVGYLCDNIDRLCSTSYKATVLDYLQSYIRTTGLNTNRVELSDGTIMIIDTGGQRSEKRKWKFAAEEFVVHAVFFVVDVSRFDRQQMDKRNDIGDRVKEYFLETVNSPQLKEKPVILLLNKVDLLSRKLKDMERNGICLNEFFPDLELGMKYDNAEETILRHFQTEFESQVDTGRVRTYATSAIDSKEICTIVNLIKSFI